MFRFCPCGDPRPLNSCCQASTDRSGHSGDLGIHSCPKALLESTLNYPQNQHLDNDAIILSAAFLKGSRRIQDAVDQRLQELAQLNEKGTLKSQRGNNDQVSVKHKVPWPQNHVLAGTSKTRVTYDSLCTFQWMAGFCTINREETNIQLKNAMLEYITDTMEDAQDFGWTSA